MAGKDISNKLMILESDRKKWPFGGKLVMSEESGVYYIGEEGGESRHS